MFLPLSHKWANTISHLTFTNCCIDVLEYITELWYLPVVSHDIWLHLLEEFTWHTVILIPKGKLDFHGIGLVEVLWNIVLGILNNHPTVAIHFHDTLHKSHTGRGMGTAFLKDNMS